jgi:hypothetical protein
MPALRVLTQHCRIVNGEIGAVEHV